MAAVLLRPGLVARAAGLDPWKDTRECGRSLGRVGLYVLLGGAGDLMDDVDGKVVDMWDSGAMDTLERRLCGVDDGGGDGDAWRLRWPRDAGDVVVACWGEERGCFMDDSGLGGMVRGVVVVVCCCLASGELWMRGRGRWAC